MRKVNLEGFCIFGITLLALLLRVNVLLAPHIHPLGGDAANYVKLAWSMRHAGPLDKISGVMFSFGYSVFIFLASFIINNLDVAAVAVSVVFGVASVAVLMFLGRLLFGLPAALVAGFGLAFYGPHIAVSVSPLSESTFIFFLLLSVYMFARGALEPRPLYYYITCGLVFGYGFIVRSEMEVVFAAVVVAGLYMLRRRHGLPPKKLLLIAALVTGAFLAINLPKIIWLHEVTGAWMLDNKENYVMRFIGRYQDDAGRKSYPDMKDSFEESVYGLGPDGELNVLRKKNFAEWLLEDPARRLSYYMENVAVSFNNINTRVAILMLLSVPAVLLARRRDGYGIWLAVACFTPVLAIPFFYSIGGRSWYGQWEPAVQFAPPLMLLAAQGLWLVLERTRGALAGKGRAISYAALAAALVSWGAPSAVADIGSLSDICGKQASPLKLSSSGFPSGMKGAILDQPIGTWIDTNLPKDARIMVRSPTIALYSNRERVMLPYGEYPQVVDYARKNGVGYIVVGGEECQRPQLDFLVAPMRHIESPYMAAAESELELVGSCEEMVVEGERNGYFLAIYRLR